MFQKAGIEMLETIRYKKIQAFVDEVKAMAAHNLTLEYSNDEAYTKAFREALSHLDGKFNKRETDRVIKRLEPLKERYFPKSEEI